MRYGNITANVKTAAAVITIGDHLFDIILEPDEALALLHWLHENEEELKALQPTLVGSTQHEMRSSISVTSLAQTFEIQRRGKEAGAGDLETADFPEDLSHRG